jgi:hypothetical protein
MQKKSKKEFAVITLHAYCLPSCTTQRPKPHTTMKLEYGQKNPHNTTGINACDFGTITKDDGEIIDITQQAYINQGGAPASVWYEAHATSRTRKDEDGELIGYKVFWSIKDGAEEIEDESEACDWDEFELKEI